MLVKVQGASEMAGGFYYEYDNASFPLGQGGMGIVYEGKCWQENDKSQYIPVAIKKITNPNPDLINRAMREASIQIENDNLLRMYGFVPNMELDPITNTPKPQYYIVMELLQGVNLDDVVNGVFMDKSGRISEFAKQLHNLYVNDRYAFVVKVMNNILNGIKALHDAGYIHRDIDPSNIMVTVDNKIKLIDFGISKTISSLNSNTQKLTSVGSIIGKVDYAAPEVVSGDVLHHNVTTDIYALGIMTYQLYVGSLPFSGDNTQVMKDQLTTPVPVENISDPVIRKIVFKATQKEQNARYQSILEFIEDFNATAIGINEDNYEKDFQKISEYSDIKKLQDFLQVYPDGKYVNTVKTWINKKLEMEDFKRISEIAPAEALRQFIDKWPNGPHTEVVKKWLKSKNKKPITIPLWAVCVAGLVLGVVIGLFL